MKQLTAREAALEILLAVEKGAYSNLALTQTLKGQTFSTRDRALITELVYGTVKTRNTLDWALERFLPRGLASVGEPIHNILRLGAYQLLYLDRVPPSAAVNEAVELAKKYGPPRKSPLVNAVLRNLIRNLPLVYPPLDTEPVAHLSLKYSHPSWLVARWLSEFGLEATRKLLQFNNSPGPTVLRVNRLKNNRAQVLEQLAWEGIKGVPSQLTPEGILLQSQVAVGELAVFKEGAVTVQEEGSMLVGHAVDPGPNSFVLDACAAPGGKATHLAELMGDEGTVLALDPHPHRVELVEKAARRLNLTSVKALKGDARQAAQLYPQKADYILVDAPCSGLGVLRRLPDARWRKKPEQLQELPQLQLAILLGAVGALKPGGVLVYSTCSLAGEENGQVADALEQQVPGLVAEDLRGHLPSQFPKTGSRIQLLPQEDGTDGFFMARWRYRP